MKVNSYQFNYHPVYIRMIVHHGNLIKEIISEIVAYLYETYKSVGQIRC